MKAAQVRIYVDADILGFGKLIASIRNDITYPGDPGAEIHRRHRPARPITTPAVLDPDWIPVVALRGWLIVTRDARIISNVNEKNLIREHGAKMVALNQEDAKSKWGLLEVFITQWRRIELLVTETGPFIWRVSRTALTPIPLDLARRADAAAIAATVGALDRLVPWVCG